jgi:fatty acid/phospholipid biosynthesis enzyme
MLGDGIAAIREFTDWENYGGAPLLGVDRAVIVTQANSGRRAFLNAIRLGAKIDRLQVPRTGRRRRRRRRADEHDEP